MTSNKFSCLVLGETGVGKSSFINAITKTSKCEVGNEGKACTRDYDVIITNYNSNNFIFIDTPGLGDAKGDKDNIKQIKQAIVDYPEFRCILMLMKFQDIRLSDPMVKILQKYMECFPLKDFWKYVFIIRTHADTSHKKFEREKKKIEGSIVKCIKQDDFKDFRQFMDTKGIALPDLITEFYVDCDNEDEPEERFESNKVQFDLIFNSIGNGLKMFKEIKKIDSEELDKSGKFEKLITKRTIVYIDQKDNQISSEPYILNEKELCNYPVVKRIPRKRAGTVISECRKTKVHMYYYETCVYNIDGKEVNGSECKIKDEWKIK